MDIYYSMAAIAPALSSTFYMPHRRLFPDCVNLRSHWWKTVYN